MIRMKVNENENSTCDECGCKWRNTTEIRTILIGGNKVNLCKICCEDLFHKCLRMDVKHDSRLKSNKDIARKNNENKIRYENMEGLIQ